MHHSKKDKIVFIFSSFLRGVCIHLLSLRITSPWTPRRHGLVMGNFERERIYHRNYKKRSGKPFDQRRAIRRYGCGTICEPGFYLFHSRRMAYTFFRILYMAFVLFATFLSSFPVFVIFAVSMILPVVAAYIVNLIKSKIKESEFITETTKNEAASLLNLFRFFRNHIDGFYISPVKGFRLCLLVKFAACL